MRKNLIIVLAILFTYLAAGQSNVTSLNFKKKYTISQRDALSPGPDDRRMIYVVDTGVNEVQIWDGDSWESLGGGGAGTLQSVTEAGATTNQDLTINADIILGNYNAIKITDGTFNSSIARPSTGFTSNRVFRIPDRDGTPALAATDGVTTINTGTDGILDLSGLDLGGRTNYINVADYGATGDGTTDDTSAIQSALDASEYKKLIFPEGIYKITQLNVGSNREIDFNNATIVNDGVSTDELVVLDSGTSNVIFKNGNFNLTGNTNDVFYHNNTGGTLTNISFQNMRFENGRYPIYLDETDRLNIYNSKFLNSSYGIRCSSSRNVNVSYNTFKGNGTSSSMITAFNCNAVSSSLTSDVNFTYNFISDTGDTSVFARCFAGSEIKKVNISNNTLVNCGKAGIKFTSPSGNDGAILSDAQINNNIIKGYSVHVSTAAIAVFRDISDTTTTITNVNVNGNLINGNYENSVTGLGNAQGIKFNYVDGGSVSNNTILNAYTYGLHIFRCNNFTSIGNSIDNSGADFSGIDDTECGLLVSDCFDFVLSSSVDGTTNGGGLYVEYSQNGKISGIYKSNATYGVYLSSLGGTKNQYLHCDFVSKDNTGEDLDYFDSSGVLQHCDYTNVTLSDGRITQGDTAKRDFHFSRNCTTNIIYSNTDTGTLQYKGGISDSFIDLQEQINLEGDINSVKITLTSTKDGSGFVVGDEYGAFNIYSSDGSAGGSGLVGKISSEHSFGGSGNYADLVFYTRNGATLLEEGARITRLLDLQLKGGIKTKQYTFASLPTGITGMVATITDADTPTYRGVASGGGTETALVMYDGTNWIYH
jgi:hypothetical protein